MQISLVRISLLRFFHSIHIFALCEFWAIYCIIAIFWLVFAQNLHKEINSQKIALAKYLANAKFG